MNFFTKWIQIFFVALGVLTVLTCADVITPEGTALRDIVPSKPEEPSVSVSSVDKYDTRPVFTWQQSSDNKGDGIFRWRLNGGEWIVDQTQYSLSGSRYSYQPESDLYPGVYTFEVQERGTTGEWSAIENNNSQITILVRSPKLNQWTNSSKTTQYTKFNRAHSPVYFEFEHGSSVKQYGASGLFSYEFQRKNGEKWDVVAAKHLGRGEDLSNAVTNYTSDTLGDGEYRFRVREYNLGGQNSPWTEFLFLIDTKPPVQMIASLEAAGTINDSILTGEPYLGDNRQTAVAVVDGVSYLITTDAESGSGGISVFRVTPEGLLINVHNVKGDTSDVGLYLKNIEAISTIAHAGSVFVIGGTQSPAGIFVFRVERGGTLTHTYSADHNATDETLRGFRRVTAGLIGSNAYVFVGSNRLAMLSFRLNTDGTLTFLNKYAHGRSNTTEILFANINGNGHVYLLFDDSDDTNTGLADEFGQVKVNADGTLPTSFFNIVPASNGANINGAAGLAYAKVGSVHYLFAGGSASNGFSIFTLNSQEEYIRLTAANANPTSGTYTELTGLQDLFTLTVKGKTYLFASGKTNNSVVVFQVNADTSSPLTHLSTLTHDPGQQIYLDGISGEGIGMEVNGVPYVFLSQNNKPALSSFRLASNGTLTKVHVVKDTDEDLLKLHIPWSIEHAVIKGKSFIFVATVSNTDTGISVFHYNHKDARFERVDTVVTDSNNYIKKARDLHVVEYNSRHYLIATGETPSAVKGISVFRIEDNGTLSNTHNTADTSSLYIANSQSITSFKVGDAIYVAVGGSAPENGISIFEIRNNGILSNVSNIADGPSFIGNKYLHDVRALTSVTLAGTVYLIAGGYSDNGVSVFRVNAGSPITLTNVFNLGDTNSTYLTNVHSMDTALLREVFQGTYYADISNHYLFTVSNTNTLTDSGISVFRINGDGSLTNTGNIGKQEYSTYYLADLFAAQTYTIQNTTYLFTTAGADKGITAFRLLYDGTLTNDASIGDNDMINLDGNRQVTAATIGGNVYLFNAAGNDNGIMAIRAVP